MANQYSVILRAINDDNVKYDLELVNSPDFLIDISTIEVGEIGKVFGISSQTFALPGNDINNQFFNNVFDIGATPAVALNKSVPCQVLVDGEAVFTGKLYIQNIVSDQYNDVIYNCVVTNETVDFRVLTENQGLADLNWAPYSHSYTYASISQSWNDQLFTGSVFYPLMNFGSNPNDANAPGFEFGGAKYQMDNPTTPLKVSQFKPTIQTKTIVDEIFKKINYKYTSSFMDSTFFKNLYFVNSVDDKDGLAFVNPLSGSYVYSTGSRSGYSGFTTLTPGKLIYDTAVYDTGNNFNLASDFYTASFTGNHIVNVNIPYTITNTTTITTPYFRQLIVYITNANNLQTANILHTCKIPLTSNGPTTKSVSGVANTGNISLNLTAGNKIYFWFAFQSGAANQIDFFNFNTSAGKNGVWLKVSTPQNPVGGTVDVSKVFGDIKTLDFMKGLIEKFNLVIEPETNSPNVLRIEPYNDWINQGRTVDWTSKVDRSVKYQISHPVSQLPKTYKFSDSTDDDMLNKYHNETYSKTYGEFTYQTDSDLANGEKTIGGFFAATPVKGLPTKGNNGSVVVPWLVKQEPGKYAQPYNFKPRLLHKQPVRTIPSNEMYGKASGSFVTPTGSTFYYIDDPSNNGVRALTYYRTLLATTDSPTDFTGSLDLHFQNLGYYPFQQSVVNGTCQDGVYNRYWAYYINSLYDIDARLLTCNIVLNPEDIKDIKLNDKIFIDGHLYRINKIKGANLIQRQSTPVELIKILPRTQPFTGRRRVPTGFTNNGQQDHVDVIIGNYGDNGAVSYVRYDDNTPITSSQVLEYVSALDGYKAFGEVVSWNNPQTTTFNPNVFILGNTKYNETHNNVMVVGSGVTIPDNLANSQIFGNNVTINSIFNETSYDTGSLEATGSVVSASVQPFEGMMIMANDATISDSTRLVLIQPSGSRIISGSVDNVVINPINDISETDPTGSVYTGNLINQGTADFKQGAVMTGSIDITGQYLVNGVPISSSYIDTGSFVTTSSFNSFTGSINAYTASNPTPTTFNYAFGTDPTNVVFLTITGATGSNRSNTINYQLTSGSTSINSGILQVTGDGTTAAAINKISEANLSGAPTASFNAVYTANDIDVRATFIGANYSISGSYKQII